MKRPPRPMTARTKRRNELNTCTCAGCLAMDPSRLKVLARLRAALARHLSGDERQRGRHDCS